MLAALFGLPIFTVASFLLYPSNEVWQHLRDTVLAEYLLNSALLMLGVGIGTLVIGVGCAWLTSLSACFPARNFSPGRC